MVIYRSRLHATMRIIAVIDDVGVIERGSQLLVADTKSPLRGAF